MIYLLIAGELSSDTYGGQLALALKKIDPDACIYAIGGPSLEKHATHFLADTIGGHSVEISEQFRHKSGFKDGLRIITKCAQNTKIDRAVIIDYPHKNFKIARLLQHLDIPITTFITPNFWLWNDVKSAKRLAEYSRNIITIFKKEYDLYKKLNQNTYFFGHPLVSQLTHFLEYKKQSPPHIVILPGSRFTEIKRLLPPILNALTDIHNSGHHFRCSIITAHKNLNDSIQSHLKNTELPINIIQKSDISTPIACTFAITASGSSTLELLIQNIPMLICGRVSWLTYIVVEFILGIKIPLIGLPNILVGKKIVPELRQNNVTAGKIKKVIIKYIYENSPETLLQHYPEIQQQIEHKSSTFNETAKVIYNDTIS